jgi:photosystem II stability/assembly factor-like uncharacterized protein
VVWVSGTQGIYAKSLDAGESWQLGTVPGADSLEFRDLYAVDEDRVWLLSAGPGGSSRIYATGDGGRHWNLQFTNPDSAAFYDCIAFWDARHGLALSDAVEKRFPLLETGDGKTWAGAEHRRLPPARPGEGAFAASGTCLVTQGSQAAWFGTGAAASGNARVYRTADRGQSWEVAETPIASGKTAGITSLAFRDLEHGLAGGGDVAASDNQPHVLARTATGGRSWTRLGPPPFPGPIFGLAYVPGTRQPHGVVAVGPGGAAYSGDEGETWVRLDSLSYWSVAFGSERTGWMVGPGGRVARLVF